MTKARPVITGLIWLSEQLGGDAFRARVDLAFLGGVGFLASLLCVVDCHHVPFF